jgi:transmembrane sensor
MTDSAEKDRATSEAADWVITLDADPENLELRARFQAWLSANPANADAWKNAVDIDAMSARLPASYKAHWKLYQPERPRTRAQRTAALLRQPYVRISRRSARRQILLGSFVAAAAACLAFFIAPTLILHIDADQVTATAELRSVQLEDGSTVRLGPDSAIALEFANGKRGVRLLKGEAFFEVTVDPDRPFQVAAGATETTVLGTAFDVRLEEAAVAVAVRNGRVQVDHRSARPPISERLEAGQWTRIAWNGEATRGRVRSEDVAAWLDGQIVARDRALIDVVNDLRRYYGGIIVLTDNTLAQQRVTGAYNVADPVNSLKAVAGTHGGSVHQISPWILVVSGR